MKVDPNYLNDISRQHKDNNKREMKRKVFLQFSGKLWHKCAKKEQKKRKKKSFNMHQNTVSQGKAINYK